MTTLQPKTIVIKTIPANAPTTLTVTSQLEHDMLDDLYGDGSCPRKRRRLTHLSQEEKLLRRKLKNRVAAQTARDRKKNHMSDLELKVAQLEQENRKLAEENLALKSESGSLLRQNEELKGRLSEIGCAPVKTEVGTGSAARTDPSCVSMDEHLHSINVDSKSDTLVSLLPTILQPQIQKENAFTTVELSSLPGTINNTPSQGSGLVGPTTKELESFKELIQFDHVYFKPQPKSKADVFSQVKVSPDVLKNSNSSQNVQKLTTNGSSNLKNVKIIITSDVDNVAKPLPLEQNDVPQILGNGNEIVDISEIDSDALGEWNFDLLEDLENILKAETEGLPCSENNTLRSQKCDNGLTELGNKSRGIKRKAEEEIKTIVDTLTVDAPKTIPSVSLDSDYFSDVPSPYNAESPYSTQDTGSPVSEGSVGSPLSDSVWEESFTELFPDLL